MKAYDDLLHFSPDVDVNLSRKMGELAELIKNDFISEHGEAYGVGRIDTISGKSYSGFIPHQEGGFSVSEFYPCGWSSGIYFTDAEREHAESVELDAIREFRRQNDIPEDAELTADQNDELGEFICDWFNEDMETMLQVEIWTGHNNDAKPETVTVRLSINFRDAPYFRNKYADDLAEFQFSKDDFMAIGMDSIVDKLNKAMGSA